jgi:hypothetical protein
MRDDLDKYIERRRKWDKEFAKEYERDWAPLLPNYKYSLIQKILLSIVIIILITMLNLISALSVKYMFVLMGWV